MDKEVVKELKVYHGHNETADAVVDRIYDTITQSKAKVVGNRISSCVSEPQGRYTFL